ncbi:MAG: Rieske 2Fe-2S domain-containing protein [Nocardioides sp.]
MGEFMREHWIPFFLSEDVELEGQPQRVRLLGEDLIVWRDTNGAVGLTAPGCAHRNAPLVFARNEECGLRCVYHGWKYDVTGQCVDMTTEPPESRFKRHIKLTAYPVVDRGGALWTYMGNRQTPPPLPDLEWNLVSAEQRHLSIRVQQCNWLQALEGEIDSSHGSVLHGRVDKKGLLSNSAQAKDMTPKFEVLRHDFGMSVAARRQTGEADSFYWRINRYLMPFYTFVPPLREEGAFSGHAWVPIDDNNTACFMFTYHPTEPLSERLRQTITHGTRSGREGGHLSTQGHAEDPGPVPYARYVSKYARENDFGGVDYPAQVSTYFSGLPGLWPQDAACQSGLQPIVDRTREHLSSCDAGIVLARRVAIDAATSHHESGEAPITAQDPKVSMIRALAMKLKREEAWYEAGKEHMEAVLGAEIAYELV